MSLERSDGTEEQRQTTSLPLFRQEVLSARQAQWLGTVLLEPQARHNIIIGGAVLAAIAVITVLFLGSYARKERVQGVLVPQHGLIRVLPLQPGVITKIYAEEGSVVQRGDPLVVLSGEIQSEGFTTTREEIIGQLVSRREITIAERLAHDQLFDGQINQLHIQLDGVESEIQHLNLELELQTSRVRLANETLARLSTPTARNALPLARVVRAEEDWLDQSAKLQELKRSLLSLERERARLSKELSEIPAHRSIGMGEIAKRTSVLEQQIAEAELQREVTITAPQDGTVTAIQAALGSTAVAGTPLLSIVPAGEVLQAHLFSPSRAMGFIRPGHKVVLRYMSFPFQKFGSYEGVVATVSRSVLDQGESIPIPATDANAANRNEAVYRITVNLERQTATAYGQQVPLQPGMELEADIVIESRRLFEWIFEPLLTLSGKWNA